MNIAKEFCFSRQGKEFVMNFHKGDTVMHWTYGLGQILRLEERDVLGLKGLYYEVQIGTLAVWVPSDGELEHRLRPPTSKSGFKELFTILSDPAESLSENRQERRTRLLVLLKDGCTQSLCRIIGSLHAYRKLRPLNESDQSILKQARGALLGEWGFVLSITPAQAESELHRLLPSGALELPNSGTHQKLA
jgi:RNA polymerase-interacting CarD/CdnL/TRCF family regulator